MTVPCRPEVAVPEHVISSEDALLLANRLHTDHDQLPLVLRVIRNIGVRKRHLIQPIEQTLQHPGFEPRSKTYVREAKARVPAVVNRVGQCWDPADRSRQRVRLLRRAGDVGANFIGTLDSYGPDTSGWRPTTEGVPVGKGAIRSPQDTGRAR